MKNWILSALVLLLSLLAGCHDSDGGPLLLTQDRDGDTIEPVVGEEFSIRLPGNPTTGYEWAVAQADPILLTLVETSHVPDSSAIGAGGLTTFRFRANLAGTTPLVLAYRRSWERTSADATFSLSVAIHDGQGRLPADE